jgi:hypothetical protein
MSQSEKNVGLQMRKKCGRSRVKFIIFFVYLELYLQNVELSFSLVGVFFIGVKGYGREFVTT